MADRQFISVFRSSKSSDTYLYVRRNQSWGDLPEALRGVFGQPVHTMDLLLTPDRTLARASGEQVLAAIESQDFFLQMPEKLDSYLVEFNQKIRKSAR